MESSSIDHLFLPSERCHATLAAYNVMQRRYLTHALLKYSPSFFCCHKSIYLFCLLYSTQCAGVKHVLQTSLTFIPWYSNIGFIHLGIVLENNWTLVGQVQKFKTLCIKLFFHLMVFFWGTNSNSEQKRHLPKILSAAQGSLCNDSKEVSLTGNWMPHHKMQDLLFTTMKKVNFCSHILELRYA